MTTQTMTASSSLLARLGRLLAEMWEAHARTYDIVASNYKAGSDCNRLPR
ncbi:hypothetical protein [Pandoraea sp.]|nr:hypothetical protein [Pandoraea sp.]MBU6491528.1 hypothetical protein [Burkholderiales bacterium]MDE2288515.1 hypothetical protein [Burkholderiales bacterium]MDE2611370.1 hypothetical protein [Burkholderiales bacterium]